MYKFFTSCLIFLSGCVYCFGSVEYDSGNEYIPMLEDGKEWGYVRFLRDFSLVSPGRFTRIACNGKELIDGTEYVKISEYSSFLIPEDAPVVAYMREDAGKVYARYESSSPEIGYNYYLSDFQIDGDFNPEIIYSDEHLLYDFNMKKGDVIELDAGFGYSEGDEYSKEQGKLTLKCIESGDIEVDGVTRRFLKFDNKINGATATWMQYEYLVEGIGPVGNCNFTMPYRSEPKIVMFSNIDEVRLLYQREVSQPSGVEQPLQGRRLYKSGYFDLIAMCDPSVYYWKTSSSNNGFSSNDNHSVSDLQIRFREENGKFKISCRNNPLKEVQVYNVIGKMLDLFAVDNYEFMINQNDYEETVFVRATTESEARTFILK